MTTLILIGLVMIVLGAFGAIVSVLTMDTGPDWVTGIALLLSKLFYVGVGMIVILSVGNALLDFFNVSVEVKR